jgi:hypothetical protein
MNLIDFIIIPPLAGLKHGIRGMVLTIFSLDWAFSKIAEGAVEKAGKTED